MFKLVTEIVAPWPVHIDVVREDGTIGRESFTARFARMPESEFEALFAPIDAPRGDELKAHNRKMIDRIMRGWEDVVDAEKKPIPFSPENVDRLLDFPNIGLALTVAYVGFHRAQPEAREKNSGPSPAGTPVAASSDAAETIAKG